MSQLFGEMRQIAFVVDDIDVSMDYWIKKLGVGPFFVKRGVVFDSYRYRGDACVSPTVSIALANSGNVQIELIEQHDEYPSIYKEFKDNGRAGLQHVSSWVTCAEFDNKKSELLSKGLLLAQECTIPSSGVRLAYFDTEFGAEGIIFEMADLMERGQYERVVNIAQQAELWDGSNPVREVKV